MDRIKVIVETQLTEGEMMIYLLVESGLSYRDLADRLLTNQTKVFRMHKSAVKKMDRLFGESPKAKKQ